MSAEIADGCWVIQKWRMSRRRMRWIIDERPSGDQGLDDTWWDWLKGLDLWDSATGFDSRCCGVGLGFLRDAVVLFLGQ